jgi:hypothetical protein
VILEVTLIVLIDYTSGGNLIFGTAPIAAQVWLFVPPFGSVLLITEELRKWLVRRKLPNLPPVHQQKTCLRGISG